jgi:hypothetical protein
VPDITGPVSEQSYLPQSAGCWKLYTEILEREYSEWNYPDIHRLTVDCYAVQHPTKDVNLKSAKSVTTHLVALCLILERKVPLHKVTSYLQLLLQQGEVTFEWLQPPKGLGDVTVADVRNANTLEEHIVLVQKWSIAVWQAWSKHHDHIRGITDTLLIQK